MFPFEDGDPLARIFQLLCLFSTSCAPVLNLRSQYDAIWLGSQPFFTLALLT